MGRPTKLVKFRVVGGGMAAGLVLLSTGCADATVGAGLPTLSRHEVDSPQVAFEGVVRIAPQGCVMMEVTAPAGDAADRWVVWPPDAKLYAGNELGGNGALIDGERFDRGDRVSGIGQIVGLEALPGEARRSGGYYAETGRYCGADKAGVIVVDAVQHSG